MKTREYTSLPYMSFPAAKGSFDSSRLPIDTIVIHTMVGTVKGTIAHFQNATRSSLTSAHYGVGFDGSIINFVPENKTAYHAGNYPVNQRSIGIECEDMGKPYEERPDKLYQTIGRLVREIADFYDIPLDRMHIKKHNEVSNSKTECPAGLDLYRIIAIAKGEPTYTDNNEGVENVVKLPAETFSQLVTKSTNWDELANYFQLTQEERLSPTAGKQVIESINQNQAKYLKTIESLIKEKQQNLDPVYQPPKDEQVENSPKDGNITVWETDIKTLLLRLVQQFI